MITDIYALDKRIYLRIREPFSATMEKPSAKKSCRLNRNPTEQ